MNPSSLKELQRLKQAMDWSRRTLMPYRIRVVDAIKQFVGFHYSNDGAGDRVPVNMIELALSIYSRQLAATSPAVLVTTREASLKPHAATFSLAMNHILQRIHFEQTMQELVINALMGLGVVKIGVAEEYEVEYDATEHQVGIAFCDVVNLDDWVIDMTGKKWEKARYMGDRCRVPLEWAKENPSFDKRHRERLLAVTSNYNENEEGTDQRIDTVGRSLRPVPDGEIEDYTELWDIWLPAEGKVVTIPSEGEIVPLQVVDWEGPENGPYEHLEFTKVPGNIMPLPPVATWMDLHTLSNKIFRKLARQAERQKTVTMVRATADADGNRTVNADDGDMIKSDDPAATKEVRFGGPDPTNLAMYLQTKENFVYFAGNLDTLGGLSPQADTLGQDEMLHSSANQRVAEMTDRTVNCARRIVQQMAHYTWNDPLVDLKLEKKLAGHESISVPVTFDDDAKQGDFPQYDIDIDPFSMQHQTPSRKLASMMNVLQTVLVPMAPMMQQQGVGINYPALLEKISSLGNLPELEDILTVVEPPPPGTGQPGQGGPAAPGMAPATTRTNVRVNRGPGTTRAGRDQEVSKAALAAGASGGRMQAPVA